MTKIRVCILGVLVLLAFGRTGPAAAEGGAPSPAPAGEAARPEVERTPVESRASRTLFVLAGAEQGVATTYRLGALAAFERSVRWDAFHLAMGYFGLGPTVSLTTPDHRGVAAWQVGLSARFASLSDGGPFAYELGGGVAFGDGRAVGVFEVGAFLTLYYFDVGYLAHIPLTSTPPDWIPVHNVAVRIVFPALRRDREVSGPGS